MAAITARVCIVTAGHLSTCPRMLKAADALHDVGYRVRVVSASHTPWAQAADRHIAQSRRWQWSMVDYSRATAPLARVATGARFKAAQGVSAQIGAARVPMGIAVRAYSRAHDELVRAIDAEPADLVYGGTTGALAAVAESAATLGIPYGIDLEDFHSGEHAAAEGRQTHALAERVERDVIAGARFVTAGSPMISAAYAEKYGAQPLTIHNTFSVAFAPDDLDGARRPLRLYWFSQTIGPGRGLEDVIRAAGRSGAPAELHLRGIAAPEYADRLRALQREVAPSLILATHEPALPDQMVALARGYDAGVSSEQNDVLNRRLCLNNKIFTYLAAGTPVLLSRTPAQTAFASEIGAAAITYDNGDVDGLGEQLRALASDVERRRAARAAARTAAERRWHWEHPLDRGALLARIETIVPRS